MSSITDESTALDSTSTSPYSCASRLSCATRSTSTPSPATRSVSSEQRQMRSHPSAIDRCPVDKLPGARVRFALAYKAHVANYTARLHTIGI